MQYINLWTPVSDAKSQAQIKDCPIMAKVEVWVEFLELSTQFCEFLQRIYAPIDHFICHESVKFFNPQH